LPALDQCLNQALRLGTSRMNVDTISRLNQGHRFLSGHQFVLKGLRDIHISPRTMRVLGGLRAASHHSRGTLGDPPEAASHVASISFALAGFFYFRFARGSMN
jgi:hypothetical protein